MKTKQAKCVYCGEVREATEEHVVPKSLYSKNHGVVIPCCEPCNNGKANDDEYFRLVFATLLESKDHPLAQEVLQKVERSLQSEEQMGFGKMIARSANNEGGRMGLNVEINRVNKIFEFITKGLLYLETGTYLPDSYSVISTFGKEEDTEGGRELLQRIRATLKAKTWTEVGEGEVFRYRYAIIEEIPRTVWEMEIYLGRRVITMVYKD